MFLSASKRIQMITIASFQFPLHKAFRRGRHNLVRDLLLAGGSAPCARELSLLQRKVERSRKKWRRMVARCPGPRDKLRQLLPLSAPRPWLMDSGTPSKKKWTRFCFFVCFLIDMGKKMQGRTSAFKGVILNNC